MAGKTTNLQLQKIADTDYAGNFPTIYNNNLDLIDGLKSDLITSVAGKQDKLIAGSGISIASDGKTISSSGKEYTAGDGIQISSDGVISTKVPSEITVYAPIVVGTLNVEGALRSDASGVTSSTIVNFGTGKHTTNSYSISITNSLRNFSSKNRLLASTGYLYVDPKNFPSYITTPSSSSPVNLSFVVLDSDFVSLTTFNKTITSTSSFSITIPSNTKMRTGNLSAYLINASW
nr:MAG TPA: hypothetical protein [Bacteriophage sp.]